MAENRPAFGPTERRAANDAQVMTFFRGYERSWRLSKLLLVRETLKDRPRLQGELRAAYGDTTRCDDQYVYGPMTSGLLFSGVAELAMLAEDLLALVKHIRSRERFARSVVHYSAGTVTNLAGLMKSASDERLLSAFMVPTMETIAYSSPDLVKNYQEGTAALLRLVRKAGAVREKYAFLYNQYKHGLTVALRPFGGHPLNDETLAKRRASLSGPLVCYDAMSIGKSKTGKMSPVMHFMLEPEIQPFLNELHASDNLLRFHGEPRDTSIDDLIAAGYALSKLIDIIVLNRVDLIKPQGQSATASTFWLPVDDPEKPLSLARVAVERTAGRWTLDSFREDL